MTFCANPDHRRDVPAIARLTYPDGRWDPTTACKSDLGWLVRQALDYGGPVLVSPVTASQTASDSDAPSMKSTAQTSGEVDLFGPHGLDLDGCCPSCNALLDGDRRSGYCEECS